MRTPVPSVLALPADATFWDLQFSPGLHPVNKDGRVPSPRPLLRGTSFNQIVSFKGSVCGHRGVALAALLLLWLFLPLSVRCPRCLPAYPPNRGTAISCEFTLIHGFPFLPPDARAGISLLLLMNRRSPNSSLIPNPASRHRGGRSKAISAFTGARLSPPPRLRHECWPGCFQTELISPRSFGNSRYVNQRPESFPRGAGSGIPRLRPHSPSPDASFL